MGTHLHVRLLHRLFCGARVEIFYRHGQRPNDVFDFLDCQAE
jgi:hypothetical protein